MAAVGLSVGFLKTWQLASHDQVTEAESFITEHRDWHAATSAVHSHTDQPCATWEETTQRCEYREGIIGTIWRWPTTEHHEGNSKERGLGKGHIEEERMQALMHVE